MRGNSLNRVLAILLIIAAPALPATQWLRIKSANFELLTTAGERKGQEAILYFEQVRGLFEKLAKSKASSTLPVRIIAFQSEKEFAPYRINESASAFYLGSRDRDYIVMKSIAPEYYPVAIHEYTHLVVKHSGLELPVWLNEGFAEIFSTLKPYAGKIRIGDIPVGRYQTLKTSKWLDLATLTAVDRKSPMYNEKQKAGIFYAESWALTHMLYFSNEYGNKFSDLLSRIKADTTQAEVFQQIYGKSLDQLQQDLTRYLSGTYMNAGYADAQLEKSAESPDVRAATALEAGLALADLLAITRKRPEAKSAYESLAREYPKDAEIPVAMARLAWMDSDRQEIRRQFARAIELGTKNPKVYVDYAMMLREANASNDEIAALFRRALELEPGLTEARYGLGAHLMNASRFGEAVIQLSQVTKLQKEMASPYYRALAYANYRLGRLEEARKGAESAVKYALDPNEAQRAQELLAIVSGNPAPTPGPPPLETAAGRPQLTRRDTVDAPPPPSRPREQTYPVEGTLQQVDCLDKIARLRVLVANKQVVLLIESPERVTIKSSQVDGVHEFTCGAQKPVRVAIEYIPKLDPAYNTEGVIRSLEFR